MRKAIAFPIIAGLAAQPIQVPFLAGAGAVMTTGSILMLGGCGARVAVPDISTLNLADLVINAVKLGCGVVPIASTISEILVALALPSATPIQQQASLIAQQICDQVNKVKAMRRAPRLAVGPDGRPVADYGTVLINGKPISILVYANPQ